MRTLLVLPIIVVTGCFPEVKLNEAAMGGTDTASTALDVAAADDGGGGGSGGNDDGSGSGGSADTCTGWADNDGDGFGAGEALTIESCDPLPVGVVENDEDCDDTTAAIHPDATEVCNGFDDDCDGDVDDEDSSLDRTSTTTWYADDDRDGYGNNRETERACSPPAGHTDRGDDCDDDNRTTNPGARETCNAIDDDCDGVADTNTACSCDIERHAGHNYLFCDQPITWTDAEAACEARSNYQLAVITNPVEQEWLWTNAAFYAADALWWLGAHNQNADYWEEPTGGFEWVDGSPFSYTAWYTNWPFSQPDDFWGNEDCVFLDAATGGWHDYECDGTRWSGADIYYVCESTLD